jgi:glc operon protein GlcG
MPAYALSNWLRLIVKDIYMRRSILLAVVVAASLLPVTSQAQSTNPPVAQATPFYIPYGPSISLGQATQVAAAAAAEATRRNWKEAIAIVDTAGELVYFERLDGCQSASVVISQAKAQAAVRYRRATKVFQTLVDAGHPSLLSLPGVVASEGGIPLVLDGKIIGAIGVSGGTAPQDGVVANAGVANLK